MLVADFWESFFLILLFLPLAMMWAFALIDIFRRDDIGGGTKALWVICVIVLPFLGTLIYLIANGSDMSRRRLEQAQAQQKQFDSYVQSVAATGGGGATELAKAKELLDSGAINQEEYDKLKAKVLA